MDYIKRLWKWFVQVCKKVIEPWPLHLIVVFIFVHISVLMKFPKNADDWNLFVSTSLQIYGGWLILKNINDNLGILLGSSIPQSISKYFKGFPTFPKRKPDDIVIQVNSASLNVTTGDVKIHATGRVTSTLERRVELLEKEINRLDKRINTEREDRIRMSQDVESKTNESINNQQLEISDIKSKLQMTIVGGIKEEVLGALIILYSLLIPYVTKAIMVPK